MDIDILEIDQKIKEKFAKEAVNIDLYHTTLTKTQNILISIPNLTTSTRIDLQNKIQELLSKISDIENNRILNYYILDTIDLLEEYKKHIKKPRKIAFLGKSEVNCGIKDKIENRYLEIIKKYNFFIEKPGTPPPMSKRNSKQCKNCGNKKEFSVVDGYIYICELCGNQTENIGTTTSYSDVSRVNISSKYTYERRVHFRDCMNQYQGKQNSTIADRVYKDLIYQFRLHGLLLEELEGKEAFKNIAKDHILLFLKELGYTKHYEDVFLIHYKLTGKKPDDISNLEQRLMDDFDILSNLYDQKFKQTKRVDRKNFINTQYVLYQLLRKYRHHCRKEDFNILKTLDRKSFHDEICLELFTDLGWNFTPFF
jgi:ribosomal protein L37AE/L43A